MFNKSRVLIHFQFAQRLSKTPFIINNFMEALRVDWTNIYILKKRSGSPTIPLTAA